jgi:hypothetical protein
MIHFKNWLSIVEAKTHAPSARKAKDILKSVILHDHHFKMYKSAKGNDAELLRMKYKEAQKDGLLEDILKNGIKNPIEIKLDKDGKQTLIKGHHRLAIALKHFPNRMIKIKYT